MQSPRIVFAIALTVRLWAASQLVPDKAWPYFYRYNEFARIAWALASGHGYSSPWANTPLAPTAVEPPIYAYILAGIFKIAEPYSYASLWIAVVLNAVLSAFTAVLILKLGKRDFYLHTGVLAAWTWSCWLYEAVDAIRLWESSLTALLLAVSLWLLPNLVRSPRVRLWLAFGVLAGVACLTNTTLLAIFPCFWLWLWFMSGRTRGSIARYLVASIGVFVLVLVPWTVRNYAVFHRLMPIRDNFGLELWLGNHEANVSIASDFPLLNPTAYNRLGEIRFMDVEKEKALQFIQQNTGEFVSLCLRRFVRFWITPAHTPWPLVSILAWTGLILAFRRQRVEAVPYGIVLLLFPVVYYVTHTYNTYRHPMEPVMLLLAASAAMEATGMVNRKRKTTEQLLESQPSF